MAVPVVGFFVRWGVEKIAGRVAAAGAGAILGDAVTDTDTSVDGIEATGDVVGEASPEGVADPTNEDARPVPGSTTDARTEECEDCNDCKPRDGYIFQPSNRNYHTGGGDWVFYQLYIANMGGNPIFSMANGKVQEWKYNGVDFDGFWSYSCTLIEAKKGYESFFVRANDGSWIPGKVPFMGESLNAFLEQADEQSMTIGDNRPTASLRWYFSAQPTYQYFQELFRLSFIEVDCYFYPYSDTMAHYGASN